MNTLHRFLVAGLLTGLPLIYTSSAWADQMSTAGSVPPSQPVYQQQIYQQQILQRTYGEKVQNKALNGLANMTTSWLEVPKSILADTNASGSNIIYGLIGGSLEGILQMGSRTGVGIIDFVTAPIPTKPIVNPQFIWDDFDQTSTYGSAFRLDSNGQPSRAAPSPMY